MPLSKLLQGIIEIDETYVGGKGDRKTMSRRKLLLLHSFSATATPAGL